MSRIRMVHRPGHPKANENNMVNVDDLWVPYEDELNATIGNRKVNVYVQSDCMEPTRHMADGKHYTSKAKFRQATKAAGCVEIGNETTTVLKPRKPIELDRRARREDIRKSIYELKNGRR